MRRAAIRANLLCASLGAFVCSVSNADAGSIIGNLNKIEANASTIPGNGDLNPYGVAIVPETVGNLLKDHILVSNFNNAMNLQGTGTTIVQVSPDGASTQLFAQIDPTKLPGPCPGGIGLTTALVVLRMGFVVVGSLPTTDGTSATAKAGCLLVLNSTGEVVKTISGEINGRWDMTALDQGLQAVLFVTNVLNGTQAANGTTATGGTVVRIGLALVPGRTPVETSRTVIGSGFAERTDPAALVIGPTGVGLGSNDVLYVADTLNNRITAIDQASTRTTDAGTGNTVTGGGALNAPLGLAIARNGDIVTANGGDGNMVETAPDGTQVAVRFVDVTSTTGAGDLFGLAIPQGHPSAYFVNDGNNTLDLLH